MKNIEERFPAIGLQERFKIFNTTEFQKLTDSELDYYGIESTKRSLDHFCLAKYIGQQKYISDIFDREEVLKEWETIKGFLYKCYRNESTLNA